MKSFIFEASPGRVVFGAGALDHLAFEIELLGARRALVLSTPQQAELANNLSVRLGDRSVGIYPHAVMHVPVEVAQKAIEEADRLGADCVVAAGGGSTIGLAKAIALESALPILAVPTTYAGSEMTPIYGLTEAGLKRTGKDRRVLPKAVIYDPYLTLDLPLTMSITSGFNAIAHAAEALYAENANPITNLMAEEGIRALARGLPGVKANLRDVDSRSDCLYGAWLCGAVLGMSNMALHHKLCHVLGGTWNLPHAETHTVILPHVLAYNAAAAPDAMKRLEHAMNAQNAASAVFALMQRLGAPMSLEEIGMKRADLPRAASLVMQLPYYNPRPVTYDGVLALLDDAFVGRCQYVGSAETYGEVSGLSSSPRPL
ncbi:MULTISPECIES: maleylacetate reductase [unclassified Bradyrhizobium]|uniref:maleylacetate reductase n=1 Tax=unclassified Bradyrhizobium TaxID=2631580 RepID=UPI00247A2964|nr:MULTISPECIES: maleylacetate reductase [unclassified Bradyrhizobium]WGS19866.1 maleylacetate reductase [Bradyrhizobium sp. ISRA463]WGS26717.1 maleylacetate reductase [Bradyrhizobium sp. ISRA464]